MKLPLPSLDYDTARARRLYPYAALKTSDSETFWRGATDLHPLLASLGQVVAESSLRDANSRPRFEVKVLRYGPRFGFLRLTASDCDSCNPLRRCTNYHDIALLIRQIEGQIEWFESLGDVQSRIADEFSQSIKEHYHLMGWRCFVEAVMALSADEDGGATSDIRLAQELYPSAMIGDVWRGVSDLEPLLMSFGIPLLRVEGHCPDGTRAETLWIAEGRGRYGLLLLGPEALAGPESIGSCTNLSELGQFARRTLNSIRWFESIQELEAHVLDDFSRGGLDEWFFARSTWARLKADMRRMIRECPGLPQPSSDSARARLVFPKALSRDDEGRPNWWAGNLRWEDLLWDFGDVLVLDKDDGHGGDYRVLLRKGSRFGFVVVGWGSCSGCDALQKCLSYREIEGVMRHIESGIVWFNSFQDARRYVCDDTSRECSHYFHGTHWQRFKNVVDTLPDEAVSAIDLGLHNRRARAHFPDAVRTRSDGDFYWVGTADREGLMAALGTVLVHQWLGGEGDSFHAATLLQSDGQAGLLFSRWSAEPDRDPLLQCRSYSEIESLLNSLADRVRWFPSIEVAAGQLSPNRLVESIPSRILSGWDDFLRKVAALSVMS